MKSKAAAPQPIQVTTSAEKLDMIRSGKKKKTVTGFKEKTNITFSNDQGKFIAVEKEKKFEEAGVTKKKRNFIMFESKLGTETDRDLHKIEGAKKDAKPKDRVEEKIFTTKKRKEYLDNYQYHETKNLKKSKPDIVIHQRWGDVVGGTIEEISTKKVTIHHRGGSEEKLRGPKPTKDLKKNKSSSILKRPERTSSATKTLESTTRVGRRGGAGGKTSTTTTTKKETRTTTKGGEKKTTSRTTRFTRGNK